MLEILAQAPLPVPIPAPIQISILAKIAAFLLPILGGIVAVAKQVGGSLGAMIAITMLLLLLRVFLMFAKAYVTIIFLIIFGPIIITLSALSQDEDGGVTGWIRSLLGNVLIFPVAGLILFLGGNIANKISAGTAIWSPPLIGGDKNFVSAAMSLGILFILPEIEGIIQKALAPKAKGLEIKGLESLEKGATGSFKDTGKAFSGGFKAAKARGTTPPPAAGWPG